MSTIGGPNVVDSGLVLELDAGNIKSYQSGSTTWFDKSGFANNGTLTNGPTFNTGSGGSIVFDGVDDYVNCGSGITTTNLISVGAWVRLNVNNIYQHIVDSSSNTWHLAVLNDGKVYFWDGSFYHLTGPVLSVNTWYYAVGVKTSTTNDLYVNGSLYGTINSTGSVVSNNINIARWQTPGSGRVLNGNVASTQIYNRALSADEVLQNYNALKSRFGL